MLATVHYKSISYHEAADSVSKQECRPEGHGEAQWWICTWFVYVSEKSGPPPSKITPLRGKILGGITALLPKAHTS